MANSARAILRVGCKELVLTWHVQHSLWLMQSGNGMESLRTFDVEDFHSIVPHAANECPRCGRRTGDADASAGRREGLQKILADETSDEARGLYKHPLVVQVH